MNKKILLALLLTGVSPYAFAAWLNTGWLDAKDLNIHMDNGMTYFSGFSVQGNCNHSRLELRETGGYYQNPENAKRMFTLITAAKIQGKKIRLGYNDTDGPACRVAQVYVDW